MHLGALPDGRASAPHRKARGPTGRNTQLLHAIDTHLSAAWGAIQPPQRSIKSHRLTCGATWHKSLR
jgi:hypothetical protein